MQVRGGQATAVNIKDGYDNAEGVSARASGFLLMLEKFQDKVSSPRHSSQELSSLMRDLAP